MYAGQVVETGAVADGVPRAAASVHARPAALGARLRRGAGAALLDPGRAAGPRRRRLAAAASIRAASSCRPTASRARSRCSSSAASAPTACLHHDSVAARRAARAGDRRWLSRCSRCAGLHDALRSCGAGSAAGCAGGRPSVLRAVDGVDLDDHARRDARARRRVGLRQVDARPLHRRASTTRPRARSATRGDARPPSASDATRRRIQMVFQDPYSSLNPRMTVEQTLAELLRAHRMVPKAQSTRAAASCSTWSASAPRALDAHPRQFSGGQRQRVSDRARAGARARAARRRRAGVGARRVGAGDGAEPARGAAREARA